LPRNPKFGLVAPVGHNGVERLLGVVADSSDKRLPELTRACSHWYDYSKARDLMLKATDSKRAPWYVVRTDDKRRGRNCIAHILSRFPYKKIPHDKVKLPKRAIKNKYDDQASLKGRRFVAERY
jgi:hypothetical protein